MDITGGINAVTAAITLAKSLSDADKALDKATMKLEMAEMSGHLADAKLSLIDAREEVARLVAELHRVKEALKERAKLVRYRGYHYPCDKAGQPIGTPYCPTCLSNGSGLYRLVGSNRMAHENHCPNCKNKFQDSRQFPYPDNRSENWKPVQLDDEFD